MLERLSVPASINVHEKDQSWSCCRLSVDGSQLPQSVSKYVVDDVGGH